MIARKCERCHKYYDEYQEKKLTAGKDVNGIGFVHVKRDGNWSGVKEDAMDLCPECLHAVIDFVNGGAKND